jgi:hypothetical protein
LIWQQQNIYLAHQLSTRSTHRSVRGGHTHFQYRGFEIDVATAVGGDGFIGTVTIWQAPPANERLEVFTSDSPGSFPARLQAVDCARVWAEIWCDEQLTPEWAAHHATVQSPPTKKQKTGSRKPLGR